MLHKRSKNRGPVQIDLSPLIDVVFLLLIFFMVSTRFRDDAGMDLSLPSSESRQKAKEELLTVAIDTNGAIRLNNQEVTLGQLETEIRAKLVSFENKMVVLRVDKHVDHGTVIAAMDAAKKAGAKSLTFATDAKSAPASGQGP